MCVCGGGVIGHSTGRPSLSTVGGGHTCVPPTVERDRRAWSERQVKLLDGISGRVVLQLLLYSTPSLSASLLGTSVTASTCRSRDAY